MENKNLVLLGAGLVMAYVFFSNAGENEKMFYVDGLGYIKESELPSYGYQMVNGQWYSAQQIAQASNQAGVPAGTTIDPTMATWNTIVSILNGLIPVVTQVVTLVTTQNKQQAIQQILAKYTVLSSPDYIPMFAYTEADLQLFSIQQLQKLLDTGTINGINGTHYIPVKKKGVVSYF
jgi:hypothetical protein